MKSANDLKKKAISSTISLVRFSALMLMFSDLIASLIVSSLESLPFSRALIFTRLAACSRRSFS
ncbi:hypothetical protein D3C86_2188910 [compost metagenome]